MGLNTATACAQTIPANKLIRITLLVAQPALETGHHPTKTKKTPNSGHHNSSDEDGASSKRDSTNNPGNIQDLPTETQGGLKTSPYSLREGGQDCSSLQSPPSQHRGWQVG